MAKGIFMMIPIVSFIINPSLYIKCSENYLILKVYMTKSKTNGKHNFRLHIFQNTFKSQSATKSVFMVRYLLSPFDTNAQKRPLCCVSLSRISCQQQNVAAQIQSQKGVIIYAPTGLCPTSQRKKPSEFFSG